MSEVQVRARRVDAELDVQGHTALELLLELVHRHDLHRAGRDDLELFVYRQHMFSFSRREPKGRIAAFQSNS